MISDSVIDFILQKAKCEEEVNTGWPKNHFTDRKIEYLRYGLSNRTDFFTSNRGIFIL